MIRVLHIHTLPVISGSGINTFLTMEGMDKKIFDPELACAPGGRLIDLVRANNIKVWPIRNLVQPLNPLRDLFALMELFFFLKKRYYHIVHTHNSKAGFLGRLSARLARVPVVIHTVHGFAFHDQEPQWRRILFRNLERLASNWCDKVIFISQPLIEWALREKIIKEEKVTKIYSGIDLGKFHPVDNDEKNRIREKWHIGQDDEVIGIVSKLWDGKGHDVLIKAFRDLKREIKKAKLIIVGEGYLHDRLNDLVCGLGLKESVLFTGFQMDVSEIVASFDVAVLPSFYEGMGRVLLEAMAMEKPVVATRVGGIPDLVDDGINGILTTPGDVKELSKALRKILMDKGLASAMGREGRKKISLRFSSQLMVESIRSVYIEQMNRKGIALGD